MKPLGAVALVAAALLLLPVAAFADDSPAAGGTAAAGEPAQGQPSATPPSDAGAMAASEAPVNPFLPGEQLIGISAGLHIPAFLAPVTGGGVGNLGLGGSFAFSYQYFVSRGFAIGGNLAGAYNSSIGNLPIYVVPLGFTASYWWTKLPFEFSVLGEVGPCLMRWNATGMIEPFAKAGAAAYWRATSSWSLGLQAYLWFVPEFHYGSYSNLTQYAGFVETSIAAVYHL